ncbi:MAG: glycosyltransferase family 4 protein [Elainellaceae cyanobacterium]
MFPEDKGQIAFISVHGDPSIEIGKEEAGGQNVYVRQVGEALAKRGWQVDMFTRRTQPNQDTIVEHAPGCRTVRLTAGPEAFVGRDELFDHLPDFVESFLKFQHQTETIYPLLHTNYWLSGWVGLRVREHQPCKLIHTYHSLGAVKYHEVSDIPPIATTRLDIEKDCLENVDCVVSTSPQEKSDMRSLVSQNGTIEIIPCGTDIERFGRIDQTAAREKLGLAPQTDVIVYVGRFDPRKGIETLVRAMAHPAMQQHPEAQLFIIGGSRPGHKDGEERDRIEGIVQELGLGDRITFTGRVKHDDLPVYYAAANVCVLPSHYEPFGLVAIESMASGTPVVASEVGGLKFTVVSEETGLVVPAKDVAAFADAMHQILSNPAWQAELGQAGRTRVESHFSWDGVAAQLDELYLSHLAELWDTFASPSVVS